MLAELGVEAHTFDPSVTPLIQCWGGQRQANL